MGGADGGELLLLPRDKVRGIGGVLGAGGGAGEHRVDGEGVERLHGLGFVAEKRIDPEAARVGVFRGKATSADGGINQRLGALA